MDPLPDQLQDKSQEKFEADLAPWHFPMMNDVVRNTAYESALKSALKNGGTVLEIGTGSGLLSMMAARHGATRVITCEIIPKIARKAVEIIQKNGFADKIQVINKLSTSLVMGVDLKERADILVTELFDDGLLGEGALQAIQHAQKHLLKPSAQIIPCGVKVMAMCIESKEIFENQRVHTASGFDVSAFNEFAVDDYTGYHIDKMSYRPLSRVADVFELDFDHIASGDSKAIDFEITASGTCHAIVCWFELKMDQKTVINTGPGQGKLSSWKQAVWVLDQPPQLTEKTRLRKIAHYNSDTVWFGS